MSAIDETAGGWGEISAYDPPMASRVAEMFNAFNELWPGGFGGRVPYDEQRVRDWLDETSAVADLIALDADGEPVGYCGLYPHWRDSDAAYVSILGVVPRVKGKRYGKRLLLRAIEIAHGRGYKRLDLHTLSGNLNAVPLYKKVGLFWVPETSVYMQNYLPGLFQIPLAKAWFDRHPDWYGCFKRELAQAPDEHVVDGMELYEYVFEQHDDRLVGQIDRYGWGFCGIERVLDGADLAVRTRLRTHEILMGIPNAMTVVVENDAGADLSAALTIEPFKGLTFSEPFPLTMSVPAGERFAITREFVVDRTAGTYKQEASEVIRSRVILGDQVLDLVTGGKIRPAVELSSQHGYHIAPPGGTTRVYLDLFNHAVEALSGKVELFVEGVADSQQALEFTLGAKEVSGIEVPVSIPADVAALALTVHATVSIEVDGTYRAMPTYRFPIVVDVADLAVAVLSPDEKHLHLMTDQLDVAVDLEGGRARFYRRTLPGPTKRVSFEIGPPFGMNLDQTLTFEHETARSGDALTLILRATSLQMPGVEIRKYIRVTPGVREVEHWATLTNLQVSGSVTVGARVYTGGGRGLSISPFGSTGRAFVPAGGRIVESDPLLPVATENLVPQEPEQWTETWTAVQGLADSSFWAWFWKPDRVAKIKVDGGMLSSLEVESATLRPGDTVELYHLWYGFSYTSLPDVRNRWNQLVGHIEIPYAEHEYGVQTVPPIDVRLVGDSVVRVGTVRRTVELRFATAYPFSGELSLEMPPGWRGAFVTPDGRPPAIPMPDPIPGEPMGVEIELTVLEGAEDASATVTLHFGGEFEMDFDLPVLLAGQGTVDVTEEEVDGGPAIAVSNGVLRFNVCAEVGGNLIRLQDAQDRTFFHDHFPEIKPWFFVNHHIGGIEPIVFLPDADTPFSEPEQVAVEVVEDGAWRGVHAAWTVHQREKLRGQRYSLTYLVLPGCPVVRVRLAHHNPTPRRVRWVGLVLLDLALRGDMEGTVFEVPGGTQSWTRHRTPMPFVSQANLLHPWARFSKGDQSLTAFVPRGYPGTITVFDLQMVAAILGVQVETAPHGESVVEFALALNQPLHKTQELIAALAKKQDHTYME